MKNLLLSTALAVCTAAIANAETASTTADAMTPYYIAGAMEISADTMIGKRIYIGTTGPVTLDEVALAAGVADASIDWEDMGEIGDVLVSATGEVGAVVIDAGGFLGMGERQVKVAMDTLQFVRDSDDDADYFIVFTGDRATLEGTTPFDQTAAESEGFMTYEQDTATQTIVGSAENPDNIRPDRNSMAAADVGALTAEDLDDARVYGAGENWIGDVNALVLADDGAVSHIVIDVGGWLGMGEHPVALSFDQVDLRRNESDEIIVYVDFTQEELEAMPAWQG